MHRQSRRAFLLATGAAAIAFAGLMEREFGGFAPPPGYAGWDWEGAVRSGLP